MIRVIISIQDRLYAESVAAALSEDGRFGCSLVSEDAVSSEEPMHEEAEETKVILLECNGAAAARKRALTRLSYRFPGGKTILLAENSDPALAAEHFNLGLCGVFPKTDGIAHLKKAILAVERGEIWACRETYSDLLKQLSAAKPSRRRSDRGGSDLTGREKEILALVAGGLKNRQIGEKLHISERTVKVHLNNVFRKIEVEDRLQAALYAINKGLTPGKVLPRP